MRKIAFLTSMALLVSFSAMTQMLKPVKWSYAAKKTSATEATLLVKATIEEGWHIYSQNIKDGGPVKTTFSFPASAAFVLVGKTVEPKAITKFENTFDMDVSFFEKSVVFQQKIKLKGKSTVVKGKVEYMVCDDKQCLPPEEIEFSIPVKL